MAARRWSARESRPRSPGCRSAWRSSRARRGRSRACARAPGRDPCTPARPRRGASGAPRTPPSGPGARRRRTRGRSRSRPSRRGPGPATSADRHPRARPPGPPVDDVLLVHPRGAERAAEPLVDLPARAQHDVRRRQRLHVVRAHLVLVRVRVGRQDRRDVRARRDVAGHVGELGLVVATIVGSRRRRRAAATGGEPAGRRRASRRIGNPSLLKLIPIFSPAERSLSRTRVAPIAAMLCSVPLMDGPHRLTRRQALRLGAGAAALGALRVPSPAFGATPSLFELALPDSKGARLRRLAHDRRAPGPAPLRPRRVALEPRERLSGPDPHPRPRRPLDALDAAAGQPRHARRHRSRLHRHRRRAPAALTRKRERPQGPFREDRTKDGPSARARRPGPGRTADRRARELGRRPGPAAQRPQLRRRPSGVRAPHRHRGRLRAGGIGRHRARASRAITATPTAGTTSATTSSSTATA